jgi:hypothetical protein
MVCQAINLARRKKQGDLLSSVAVKWPGGHIGGIKLEITVQTTLQL